MKLGNAIKAAAIACGVLALGFAQSANAVTTATSNFAVTATVQSSCTISAGPLAFGTYTVAAASTATSSISVTCTNSTGYNVGLNAGSTPLATVTTRQMVNGANTLNYTLYSDSGRTKNWGNTIGTDTVTGTGSGAAQTLTVYGTVPAAQFATPGSYADTVTATITY